MSILAEASRAFVASGLQVNTVSNMSTPGILVFSRALQLQYVNRRAIELIRNICKTVAELGAIVFPARVLELRNQIKERLDDRLKTNNWEPFEVSRVVSERGRRVLLRGFGQPDRAASHYSRIIIVLQELRSKEKDRSQQMHARMKAPERQTAGGGLLVHS